MSEWDDPLSAIEALKDFYGRRPDLMVIPRRLTLIDHYPIREGEVVVRWRGDPDPDACGYIVEANVGGVIVEGSGHYGESLAAAVTAGRRIADHLARTTHDSAVPTEKNDPANAWDADRA